MSTTSSNSKNSEKRTLVQNFQETVASHGAKTALRYKNKEKVYQDLTYADLARRVTETAAGLAARGVGKGDRVAILSENRPEWVITDLATLTLGGITVPIYPTLPSAQVGYIVRDSSAKVLVVENAKQLKKVEEVRADLPDLQHVFVIEDADVGANAIAFSTLSEPKAAPPAVTVSPDDVASIVYTSGTTGDPKGAQLTHANLAWNVDAALEHFRRQDHAVTTDDTFLSFLPLSHVFERTTGYYLPIRAGATITYCEGVRTLVDDMAATQPTLMVCVPRVYEAMQERIQDTVAKRPEEDQKKFREAIAFGTEYAERKREGKGVGPVMAVKHLAYEKLAFGKLRERFGGKFRFFVAGGAALSPETAKFFEAIGLPVIEGYGMTEAAPVMAVNPNQKVKIGTVGTVVPGGELRIAPDGEILYRGPNVMKGYWNKDEATHEMIDQDGWLHTGDVGQIDDEGYLKITDRKKDILVLANGKNVAPQPIEAKLKQSPFISEVVLIGDKQSVITALIVPNKSKLGEWAKAENLTFADDDALLALPEVRKKIRQEIDAHSKELADFEKVKKFTLLNATFSVESGEITPTLKVKRKVVLQKYAPQVAAMRGGEE